MLKSCRVAATLIAALLIMPGSPRASTADAASGCVALTFDDGPDRTLTPQVLTLLRDAHVQGTFFVVGQRVRADPDIVRRTLAEGHEIGNHTFDHRLLISLTEADLLDEIALTDKAVIAATGLRPTLIRPPYGFWSPREEAALRAHGLMRPVTLWDADSLDWLDDDADTTMARAGAAASGSIVLMHDIHASTVAALPGILARLAARKMRLTTVSGLPACLKGLPPPPSQTLPVVGEAKALPETPSSRSLLGAVMQWTRSHGPS